MLVILFCYPLIVNTLGELEFHGAKELKYYIVIIVKFRYFLIIPKTLHYHSMIVVIMEIGSKKIMSSRIFSLLFYLVPPYSA